MVGLLGRFCRVWWQVWWESVWQVVVGRVGYVVYALYERYLAVRDSVADGSISAGHGRALLGVSDESGRKKLWQKIMAEGLSVRETEVLTSQNTAKKKRPSAAKKKNPDAIRAEEELKAIFGTKVSIGSGRGKGKIEIEYYSPDELNRLLDMLKTLG